jgi:hypothetical protein
MRRLIPLLIVPALALAPGTALGHGKSKTTVYKGTFTLVGADGDYVTGNFGKAQLVDNKRNDKLSVHVRRVAANTTYMYRLQKGVCKAGAAGGTDVAGFTYKPLRTNRKGVGNSTARSRTFRAERGTKYSVVVSSGGEVVLCAQLTTKHWRKAGKPSGKGHHKPKPTAGKDRHKPKPKHAPGHAEDKTRGKSEDAPGQAEDKTRGKSGEAPRGKAKGDGQGGRR